MILFFQLKDYKYRLEKNLSSGDSFSVSVQSLDKGKVFHEDSEAEYYSELVQDLIPCHLYVLENKAALNNKK